MFTEWPPAYSIRISTRARYVQLRITKFRGLEIISPHQYNSEDALHLLSRHRQWIERVWMRTQPITADQRQLPEEIALTAIGQHWQICYEPTESDQVFLRVIAPGQLLLQGKVTDYKKCQKVLCNWLRKIAAETLLPWLKELSVETNLTYAQGRISSAATRWGSCSAKKNISLNFHLLFLPKDLTRHVLIHELCHTIVLDHSIRFWRLLGELDSNSEVLRQDLKKAQKYLPNWVMEE